MAGYLTESSSDEEFSSNRGQSGGGIQPYRFEPACQNRKESAVLDSEEEVGNDPFTHGINFGSRVGQPANEWCTCDRCAAMASPVMNICCHELEELQPKLYTDDLDCILLHRDFNVVVLEEAVLRTALIGMKDVKRTSFVEPIKKRTFRLAAYRQFTRWCHRGLGKGVRKVIPSCVVRKIRESYPDPSENYTGFREADETDNVYPD